MRSSSPLFTLDHMHATLAARGFRIAAMPLGRARLLGPGCALAAQFGDHMHLDESAKASLVVKCILKINGETDCIDTTRWRVTRSCSLSLGQDLLDIMIDADLFVGDVTTTDIEAHGSDAYRHLRMLIADARHTLHDLPITRHDDCITGPAMRIEVRFLGEIAAGRSGLIAARDIPVSGRYVRMARTVCDWLSGDILPDLARGLRDMMLQINPSISVERRIQTSPLPLGQTLSIADCVSIVPTHESVH